MQTPKTTAEIIRIAGLRDSAKLETALVGVDVEALVRALPDSAVKDGALWYDVRDQWAEGVPGYDDADGTLVAKFAAAIDAEANRRSESRR